MKTSSRIGAACCALMGVIFISAAVWADDTATTLDPATVSATADSATANAATSTVATPVAAAAATPSKAATATPASRASSKQHLSESQIPVFLKAQSQKPVAVNPWGRLLLSLMIIGTVGGGMMVFGRWYSGKSKKGGDLNKIRILTQFHIGPKKSLAIVRVAGEAILIGITDHNISMLKSLSLLDGELDTTHETSPVQDAPLPTFQKTLAAQPSAPAVDEEDEFAIESIKDRVSLKLKNMRPF